jgi:hypothetical protein
VSTAGSSTPVHLDPSWRYIALLRANGDRCRQPMLCLPENLPNGASAEKVGAHRLFWDGIPLDWEGLLDTLDQGYDAGLLTGQSGLVVVDCDVKRYDGAGFVVNGNTATLDPGVTKRGIDDLACVVGELGHSMAELATYAVQTKSGGVHLYYRANPRHAITSTGHRHEWRIDVKASRNTWVVVPPTPGYRVIRDLPVIELPDWFASWLADVNRHLPPVGGRRHGHLTLAAREARLAATASQSSHDDDESQGLFNRWVRLELELVRLANQHGGWNQAIYQCARNLFDGGLTEPDVRDLILLAAAPTDDREARRATQTIQSAWRGHVRNGRHGLEGNAS